MVSQRMRWMSWKLVHETKGKSALDNEHDGRDRKSKMKKEKTKTRPEVAKKKKKKKKNKKKKMQLRPEVRHAKFNRLHC